MSRRTVPSSVITRLMLSSRRRCCICAILNGDFSFKEHLQIAHLDHNSSKIDYDSLVVLCLEHHAQYDSVPKQSKGLTPDELRRYKRELEERITCGEYGDRDAPDILFFRDSHLILDTKRAMFRAGQWFRPYGPAAVDFEQDVIVGRRQVPQILAALNRTSVVFLTGHSSSGKTVIARNVAYDLHLKGIPTTFMELKRAPGTLPLSPQRRTVVIAALRKLKGVLIIDDGHMDIDLVEEILRNRDDLRILVATRPINISVFSSRYALTAEGLANPVWTTASEVADRIVSLHLGQHPSKSFSRYHDDLWELAMALNAYTKYGSIDQEQLTDYVVENMIQRLRIEYGIQDPESILLPLAAFFSREIYMSRDFLIGSLGCQADSIDRLVTAREIAEDNRMLSIDHSSRAQLALRAFRSNRMLGWGVKRRLQERFPDWEQALFHLYLRWAPPNLFALFRKIRFESSLVHAILSEEVTAAAVFDQVDKEMSLSVVFGFYQDISWTKDAVVSNRVAEHMNNERLLRILNDENVGLDMIAFCLIAVPWNQDPAVSRWLDSVSRTTTTLKVSHHLTVRDAAIEDIECPFSIPWSGDEPVEVVMQRIQNLQNAIPKSERIEFTEDMVRRSIFCNWNLYRTDPRICLKAPFFSDHPRVRIYDLVEGLDENRVVEKIRAEKSAYVLAFFIKTIAWANADYIRRLLPRIRPVITKILRNLQDRQLAAYLLWSLLGLTDVTGEYLKYVRPEIRSHVRSTRWV